VLVPESSTTIQAGGKPVQVTFNLAFAGNEDVGANLVIKGPGAEHVELMAFINVGSTTPSWAYVGVVADKEPLPASLTLRATTPVSSLLSSTHTAITAKIDTVDANASLTLRAGRADLPTGAVPATLTAVDLAAVLAALAAHGLNLSGLPVPPTGSTTVTVQAPTADPGPGAFANAMVPSMTDVSATLTKPDGTPLGTSSWTAAIDLKDGTASAQPSVTTLDWTASAISTAVVAIASKDAVAKQGLDHRTGILMVNAGSLPKTVHAVLTAMPDIAFGGTSPDPALAAPAIEYTADGRLASLDVMTLSQATPVNPVPPGGTPAPNTAGKVSAVDVPRHVVVRLGQWDPNHPKDGYVDLQLLNENGGADVLGRLGAATIAAATIPPMLTTGPQQQVRVEGSAGTRAVDLIGLKRITVKTQPRPVTSTQTVTSAELHYIAATARSAIVTLIDDDLGATVITANDLPAEVTGSAQVPDAATLQDATATWSANAHLSAASSIGTVHVTKSPPPNASALGHDQLALDITAKNLPVDVIVKGENTGATQRTELTWLAPATMSTLTGRADITRYSVPAAPFLSVQGSVEILPRGVALGITRSTAGVDVQYGGSDRIPHADATVRSTGLITPRPGQYVPFDHATVRVTDIPATGNDPQAVAAGPRLTVLVDTSGNAGLVSHIDVPTGVDPLGIAHVRVVDDRADAADGDTFGTPSGVRWINRPRVAVDDLPGAPVGSLLALTLPQLRAARYDGRNGLSLPSQFLITRGISAGEQALGVQLSLDGTDAVTLELAVDDDKGSTWVNGTLSAAR
jgi:hypothetical protein